MNDHSICHLHLAFYNGRKHGRWLDRVIARHDRGPFSHVELVFTRHPRGRRVPCFSSSWRDGGVRFKWLALGGVNARKWTVIPVPLWPTDVLRVRNWCVGQVGGRYDVPGVLAFKLPFVRNRLDWWFCSEICTRALQQAGLLRGVRPASLSPNGLFRRFHQEVTS